MRKVEEIETGPGRTDLWCWWGSGMAGDGSSMADSRRRWLVAALALFRWGRGGVAGLGSSTRRWGSSLEGQFGRREVGGESSTMNSSLPAAMAGCLGVRAGRGSAAPFIGKARGGETSWTAGAALRAKGRAGWAEGTCGSGSAGWRSSWHAIGGSLPRG
jgi:hypothetical protein